MQFEKFINLKTKFTFCPTKTQKPMLTMTLLLGCIWSLLLQLILGISCFTLILGYLFTTKICFALHCFRNLMFYINFWLLLVVSSLWFCSRCRKQPSQFSFLYFFFISFFRLACRFHMKYRIPLYYKMMVQAFEKANVQGIFYYR